MLVSTDNLKEKAGSGKTTVVKAITEQLQENVVVIPQDSYYKDLSHYTEEQKRVHNFDHPDSIDFDPWICNSSTWTASSIRASNI